MAKISISQIVFHCLFWLLVGAGIYQYMLLGENNQNQALWLMGVITPVIMISSYLITYYLIPNFLLKGRKLQFFLYLIYTIISSLYLSMCLMVAILMTWANYAYVGMPEILRNQFNFFLFIHIIVLVFVGLNAINNWYKMQNNFLSALKEKETAELKFLKTQLQPHFLFNTLNNLYYLCLQKSDQAPEVVLKLSQLLDYVLHTSQQELVTLEVEWEKLHDYCYLESLRYADRLTLTLHKDEAVGAAMIPPLLLITLAENCFKHGAMQSDGEVTIDITVIQRNGKILFEFANSVRNSAPNKTDGKSGGIGLQNIRKQLTYHFGDRYKLLTEPTGAQFKVQLFIPQK